MMQENSTNKNWPYVFHKLRLFNIIGQLISSFLLSAGYVKRMMDWLSRRFLDVCGARKKTLLETRCRRKAFEGCGYKLNFKKPISKKLSCCTGAAGILKTGMAFCFSRGKWSCRSSYLRIAYLDFEVRKAKCLHSSCDMWDRWFFRPFWWCFACLPSRSSILAKLA